MLTVVKNGRVVDPANNRDEVCDILVEGSVIADIGRGIAAKADRVIDASGRIVIPGIVDMHVHLREPGREDKETVASGTAAAARGGVTSLLAMPNTDPAVDSVDRVRLVKEIAGRDARVNVYICAAITLGRRGAEIVDVDALKGEGVVALTDDGASLDSEVLMREALRRAYACGLRVLCHCEDTALSCNGVVNFGLTSTRMGLRGISAASEYERVKRDVKLAQELHVPVHIQHVSCRQSVEIIAQAKKRGAAVTAETAPHYFALSEEAVLAFDPNMKMNPPLRGRDDVSAVKQGLCDGTIDVIASDHAPHTENEKEIEFERAAFGVTGLETELSVAVTELVHPGVLGWSALVDRMALSASRILGLRTGTLGKGVDADIVVVDPGREWVVEKNLCVSKSKNSPFLGKKLRGVVEYTLCAGKVAYENSAQGEGTP